MSSAPSELEERLRRHVWELASEVGDRSYQKSPQLNKAAAYVAGELSALEDRADPVGPRVTPQPYFLDHKMLKESRRSSRRHDCGAEPNASVEFKNFELVIPGRNKSAGAIVVGAHYDTAACTGDDYNPGADDNASGVAILLEIARIVAKRPASRTIRFVALTNEESPFYRTAGMGSRVYAESLANGAHAMLSLETLGYYNDEPGSQLAPLGMRLLCELPDVGDFLAFVGDSASKDLLETALRAFREAGSSPRGTRLPAEGVVGRRWLTWLLHKYWDPTGLSWSDHSSFWMQGVPAIMVTDTAPNRNRCYHRECDRPHRLDYRRMEAVVHGLAAVVLTLADQSDG